MATIDLYDMYSLKLITSYQANHKPWPYMLQYVATKDGNTSAIISILILKGLHKV